MRLKSNPGIIGPIIATSFVSRGVLFSRYYLLLLAHRALCLPVNYWTFWHFERDNASPETLPNPLGLRRTASASNQPKHSQLREFKKAFKNKTTLISASFIFAYQGAEVSISGWVLNYLIHYRGGVPAKVGYVTAGFWVSGRYTYAQDIVDDNLMTYTPTGRHHPGTLHPPLSRPAHWRQAARLGPCPRRHGLPGARMAGAQRHRRLRYVPRPHVEKATTPV